MTRLLSATYGCVTAEGGTRGGTNRPTEKYEGTNEDMNGGFDALGMVLLPSATAKAACITWMVSGEWTPV